MTASTDLGDCWYCLNGLAPAGIHPILGPVYRDCPACVYPCDCDGDGLYSADFTCLNCLAGHLATKGLSPRLCGTCLGVVDLVPLDTTWAEVKPHAHHQPD